MNKHETKTKNNSISSVKRFKLPRFIPQNDNMKKNKLNKLINK